MKEHIESDDIPQSEADRLLDLYLATLPRFEPGAAFADRVMARIARPRAVAAAAPARAPRVPALIRKPAVGWSLAGSAAFSSAALTALTVANLETMWAMVTAVTLDAGVTSWHALLGLVAVWSAWVGESVAAFVASVGPGPVIGFGAATVIAMPLSVFGLLLALRPAPSRTRTHAAR